MGWPHPSAPTLGWRGGPPGDVDAMGCEMGMSFATRGSFSHECISQPLCYIGIIPGNRPGHPAGPPPLGHTTSPSDLGVPSDPSLPSPLLWQCCRTVPSAPSDPEPVGLMDNPAPERSPSALASRRCRNLRGAGTSSPLISGRPIRATVQGCTGWC